jgi:hypothetical protein
MVYQWSAERVAALALNDVKNLRVNALQKGNKELIALCDAELANRKPPKPPTTKDPSLSRGDQYVCGYHFVCPQERGVIRNEDGTLWTGTWVVDKSNVEKSRMYGAYVALHVTKSDPSYIQGRLKDWRPAERDSEYADGQLVKIPMGVDFLLEPTNLSYEWIGDASGSLLFDWCWQNNIPLKFYGRLDDGVAVSVPILTDFLSKKSPNFVCRLVQHHHAKVIWWRGVGAYIGSANLTDSAWYRNIEAGCFFSDEDIDDEIASDLLDLFATLEENATPLTEEVLEEMKLRARSLDAAMPDSRGFWASPSFKKWPGLVQTTPRSAADRKRTAFLEEWHATLQDLRDIGARVSQPENRPIWISAAAPAGAQADQFLHAHYYQRTFDGRKANYDAFFEENKERRAKALAEAIQWWR